MRTTWCVAALVGIWGALAVPAHADEKADTQAIIAKAIKAVGGKEALAKFPVEVFKAKGKVHVMGQEFEYTGDWTVQPPSKMHVNMILKVEGMDIAIVRVFDGEKLWMNVGGMEIPLDDEQLKEEKENMYVEWVTSLRPLDNKGFETSLVGESKVNDKPAVGVRVSHKGHRDVNLYFDKETGLLVKSETQVKDMEAGKEVTQETFYQEFKEVNGLKKPMKMEVKRDGKPFLNAEVLEISLKEKVDESKFKKPE